MGPPVYLTGNCRTIYPGFALFPSPSLFPPFLAVLMMQPQTAACTCCHSQRSQQSGSREHFKALFGVRNIFAIASSIGARFTYVFAVIANTVSRCVVSPPSAPGVIECGLFNANANSMGEGHTFARGFTKHFYFMLEKSGKLPAMRGRRKRIVFSLSRNFYRKKCIENI